MGESESKPMGENPFRPTRPRGEPPSRPLGELNLSATTPPAKRPNSVIYDYEQDTPDRLRPHKRHRRIVSENEEVTREVAEPCPCQAAGEELQKQFWAHIHRSQSEREAEIERRLREKRLAREAEAKKKAAKTAESPPVVEDDDPYGCPPVDENDPYEYLFVAEEKRQRELLEDREFESREERLERERQEREDEGRILIAMKFKEILFPPGSFFL